MLSERYCSETDISKNQLRDMVSSFTLTLFENHALDNDGFFWSESEYSLMRGINRHFDFTTDSLASIIKCDADNLKKYDIIIDGIDISNIILADHKESLAITDWTNISKDNAIALLEAHRNKNHP